MSNMSNIAYTITLRQTWKIKNVCSKLIWQNYMHMILKKSTMGGGRRNAQFLGHTHGHTDRGSYRGGAHLKINLRTLPLLNINLHLKFLLSSVAPKAPIIHYTKWFWNIYKLYLTVQSLHRQDLVCGLQCVLWLDISSSISHHVVLATPLAISIISTQGTMANIRKKITAASSLLVNTCFAFSLNCRSTRKIAMLLLMFSSFSLWNIEVLWNHKNDVHLTRYCQTDKTDKIWPNHGFSPLFINVTKTILSSNWNADPGLNVVLS